VTMRWSTGSPFSGDDYLPILGIGAVNFLSSLVSQVRNRSTNPQLSLKAQLPQ